MKVEILKPIQNLGVTLPVGHIIDLPATRVAALGACVKPVVEDAPAPAPTPAPKRKTQD